MSDSVSVPLLTVTSKVMSKQPPPSYDTVVESKHSSNIQLPDVPCHYRQLFFRPLFDMEGNKYTKQLEELYIQRREVEIRYNVLNEEIYKVMGLELNYLRSQEQKLKKLLTGTEDKSVKWEIDIIQRRIEDLQFSLHDWRRPDFC